MLQFNFDATKGETPASIAQKRALVAQLMTGGRAPQNVGEGFSAIGDGIVANVLGGRAEAAEAEGRSGAQDMFRRLITGQGGAPTPSYDVASIAPQTASDATAAMAGYTPATDLNAFDWSRYAVGGAASRPDSFTGLNPDYAARVADMLAAADAELGPGALKITSAYRSPELQAQLYADAVAKYGSEEAARKWVAPPGRSKHNSGMAVDFANSQGSLLRDANSPEAQWIAQNAARFGLDVPMSWEPWQVELAGSRGSGGGAAAPVQVAQGPDMAMLMEAASNPFIMADPGMASVVNSMLQQQMQMSDPRYQQQLLAGQLGIEQAQLELEAMRNPAAPKPIEVGGVLLDPTTFEPIFDSRSDTGFTLSPGQQRFDAQGNPIASGQPEPVFRQLSPEEAASSNLDPSKAWQVGPDNRIYEIGGSGVNVTTNVAGGNKFDEAFATQDAAALSDISSAGIAAQRNLGRIDQLASLLEQAPNGFGALLAQRAGEFGIETEGLDTIQAAQAIINSLVPEQRQPGSGPMSDADLELFKQSLPRIINTPQGNRTIIDTMRAIAEYDAQGAEIVRRLRAGEIDRSSAFDQLQSRSNPLQAFNGQAGAASQLMVTAPNQSRPPSLSQAEYEAAPSGTVFTAPDGSLRVKP